MKLRIVTAREQAEMLSPWRTAMPGRDAYDNSVPQSERRQDDPPVPTGPWYHSTQHDLPDGTVLVPRGGDSHWEEGTYGHGWENRPDWVWMSNDPEAAAIWGPHMYEVEPHVEGPWPWNGHKRDLHPSHWAEGEYVAPRATILRRVPPEESREYARRFYSPDKRRSGRRTAAPVPGKRPRMTTREVIDHVRDQTGIELNMVSTGGNCNVLEGRLEDGSWLRAADHNDFCHWSLEHRHDDEREHGPMGWDVTLYPNRHDGPSTLRMHDGTEHHFEGGDYWDSGYPEIHHHEDPDAYLHELPRVIGDAFASMPHDAKQKNREAIEESLTRSGWKPGSDEWESMLGQHPGSAPAAPDYEKLVNPRDDLDDDFGDIFGRQSMLRRAGFEWLPSGGGPSDDGGEEAHTETGHLVQTHHAYPPGGFRHNSDPIGWGYSIWEYEDDEDDSGYECVGEAEPYPTHEEAKKAAEEHYYRLDHSKGRAPRSGIDYEKLVNPRQELDDDFGDIFGGGG